MPWLSALFPDALFLWILRDWRPVVSSTALKGERDFGGETFGVKPDGWRDVEGQSAEMRAAWQYREGILRLEEQAAERPGRFFMPWYEDLCRDPVSTMREVAKFAGLPFTAEALAALPKDIRPPSDKWKIRLAAEAIDEIRAAYGDVLERYEYPPA